MKLELTFPLDQLPFEGDQAVRLQGIPEGAQITTAEAEVSVTETEVTVTPNGGDQAWGATKEKGTVASADGTSAYVIVDFHTRRTVTGVALSKAEDFTLQIDLGGAWASVRADGTLVGPKDEVPDFKPNADGAIDIPALTVQRLKLTGKPDSSGILDVQTVTCRSFPSNVTLRFGDQDPFWAHPGELSDPVTTPNSAEFLSAYLDQAETGGGYHLVPLTVHSDSIAFLRVELTIEYNLELRPLADIPEKTMVFTSANLRDPNAHTLAFQLPRGAEVIPGQAGLALSGAFEADRLVPGAVEEGDQHIPTQVTPGRTLAQALRLPAHYDVTAIDLHLAKPRIRSEIHVSLQTNAAGKPSGQVLATAEVQPEKLVAEGAQWSTVVLPEAVKLKKNITYWLVLSVLEGQAEWSGRPRPDGVSELRQTIDNGQSWQTRQSEEEIPRPLAALYRLRYLPPVSQFTPPLCVQIGDGPEAIGIPLDAYGELGRLDFDLDFDREMRTYLEETLKAAPTCVPGERVINGDFRDWPPGAAPAQWTIDSGIARLFSWGWWFFWWMAQLGIYYSTESRDWSTPWSLFIVGKHEYKFGFRSPADASPTALEFSFDWLDASGRLLSRTTWEITTGSEGAWYETRQTALPNAKRVEIAVSVSDNDTDGWEPEEVTFYLAEKTILSQTMSITSGCSYDLSFVGFSFGVLGKVEVRWLNGVGAVLGTDEEPIVDLESLSNVWSLFHRRRLSPPAEATSAEVRCIQPEGGSSFVAYLSLFSTANLIHNGDFAVWAKPNKDIPEEPSGWSAQPPGTVSQGDSPHIDTRNAARLHPESEETVLEQTGIPVTTGQGYEFSFQAVIGTGHSAQAEIRWADEAGQELADEAILIRIEPDRLGPYAYGSQVPDGATQAAVRFIQPEGGECLVGNVALRQLDSVSVPLTFLADTPGELTVFEPHIAYDLSELPRPPRPSIWLFMGRQLRGQTPQPLLSRLVGEPRRAAPPPPRPIAPAEQPITAELSRSPLTTWPAGVIHGVGPALETALTDAGIITVGDLAAVDLTETITGVTPERLLEVKTKAELILSVGVAPDALPAPAEELLETLLLSTPDDLAASSERPRSEIDHLQQGLRALRLHLKNDAFRNLRLFDLMPGGS